jgi:hypothetical protein
VYLSEMARTKKTRRKNQTTAHTPISTQDPNGIPNAEFSQVQKGESWKKIAFAQCMALVDKLIKEITTLNSGDAVDTSHIYVLDYVWETNTWGPFRKYVYSQGFTPFRRLATEEERIGLMFGNYHLTGNGENPIRPFYVFSFQKGVTTELNQELAEGETYSTIEV